MMMTRFTRPVWVVVAASCAFVSCGGAAPEEVATASVVPVHTEAVVVGTIRSVAHAAGIVNAGPEADLVVRPPAPARIAEMPKAQGDAVRKGDVLVRFDIPTLAADTASRRAEVARATARLQNARIAQARARDLFTRGVAARREQEDADRELVDAEAALSEANAAFTAASTLAGRAVVRATFDGIVASRSHNPGDLVEPGSAEPVLRVVDPRRLEVTAGIPVGDVRRVVPGAAARVFVSSEQEPELAKVASRPSAVDSTASAPARLKFDAPTHLAIGTPVQVEIDAEERRDVTLAPVAAIVREGNETAVFVVSEGRAQRRVVETGLSDGTRIEIRSGLHAGEIVITHGHAGLPDGAPVSAATPAR